MIMLIWFLLNYNVDKDYNNYKHILLQVHVVLV